ncbi:MULTISPECIES: crossover junction endodeoxyribonuclease RuvC [Pseudomonas]|jgi:crossover junction endodeoxyribonuclease RuvC|uniref:Crossover junction endodeoxyribonuclease RuvC n=1 Tax=Pseudomonas abyssi TaxID=170540 RepID=A0A395QY85_9PSED|nr:crossover junction endodeoxyribonuclease RuvC [Halopseudomonas gallaeciensis]MAG66412.1 crossover junction endodeoxyribonuclease RuvC [Pseudomonadales bacterium]RGP52459.1 Holliday junction resolvase [Halopseudomonas gallaeciensis]
MALILGIDPGSRITGFGIVRHEAGRQEYVTSGCIRVGEGAFPERLQKIFHYLSELIEQYRPEVVSIEQVFMARNPDSALKLGQARGAAIVAAVNAGLTVHEYSARQVKQAVVGTGAADKKQVQHMVTQLLGLAGTPQADAADALAIALCHAHMTGVQRQMGNVALAVRAGRVRRR